MTTPPIAVPSLTVGLMITVAVVAFEALAVVLSGTATAAHQVEDWLAEVVRTNTLP